MGFGPTGDNQMVMPQFLKVFSTKYPKSLEKTGIFRNKGGILQEGNCKMGFPVSETEKRTRRRKAAEEKRSAELPS